MDIYLKYKRIVDLLAKEKPHVVLEVGFGEFGVSKFYKGKIIALDKHFQNYIQKILYVNGESTSLPFKNSSIPVTISVDTLEHMPKENRIKTIQEMIRVSQDYVIIAFPSGDRAQMLDKRINTIYNRIFKKDQIWLREHLLYGLPHSCEIESYLKNEGYNFKSFPSFNIYFCYVYQYFNLLKKVIDINKENFLNRLYLKIWNESNNILGHILYPFINFGETYRKVFLINLKDSTH